MAITLCFALALLITMVLLPICQRYAPALGLMDRTDGDRKVHHGSIPRSGGLAIVGGAVIAALVWMPLDAYYLPLMGSIGVIVVFGVVDDLKNLPSHVKLLGQLCAAGLFIGAYGLFPHAPFFGLDSAPQWLCLAFSMAFLIGVTNGVNLSDGLDGLAAGNSLLSLCMLALFAAQVGEMALLVMALTLAGGLLGFLRFNTHPATIFMGDTGSQFLGFTGAALAVLIMQQETIPLSPMVPLLIFGLPILDVVAVMAVRLAKRRPLFSADRNHLHHQLLELGFRHNEAVAILYGLQAIIVSLAYLLKYESDLLILAVYLLYGGCVLGLVFTARVTNWRIRAADSDQEFVERRNSWLRRLTWYQVNAARVFSVGVGGFLIGSAAGLQSSNRQLEHVALLLAGTLTAIWWFLRDQPKMLCRMTSFAASALVLYAIVDHPVSESWLRAVADVYLAVTAGALFLAIRVTRKSLFHLDNQDYLVLLIVALATFLSLEVPDGSTVALVALRLAVLLYVCEYIATKGRGSRTLLNVSALGSLAVLGFA